VTRRLVLVTGTGRSGTSTIAGSLSMLGLHVPGPYLGANESNPKGFYESRWAVNLHKRIAKAAGIHDFDSRPTAFERAQAAITPELEREVVDFLRRHGERHDQVVVKDPRSAWAQGMWRRAADEAGFEIGYLSMLRHPAEVVGSRTTYYASKADGAARRRYETFNVARWVNASLISERETRGQLRSFVRYTDLLEDWRPVLERVASELGLSYPNPVVPGVEHQVDSFIDPQLRRHRVTWADLEVPGELRLIADGVWEQLMLLHDGPADEEGFAALDALAERYDALFAAADAISHDATEEARLEAREAGRAEATRTPTTVEQPSLDDVSGRLLASALARRVRSRLRR
jgi:hypothetical protein